MEFDVYCDESRPDLFTSQKPTATYLVIGGVWLMTSDRERLKADVHSLRDKFKIGGEFKWQKVSPSRIDFYTELVDWFFERGDSIRFRCIAVDGTEANLLQYRIDNGELAFYKFYYQLLHHWVLDFNHYKIFCDFKRNRDRDHLTVLKRCLEAANLSSQIDSVQAIRSEESVLVQLADLFTGAVSARLNDQHLNSNAKLNVVERIERHLKRRIGHTYQGDAKFNVFKINPTGGW